MAEHYRAQHTRSGGAHSSHASGRGGAHGGAHGVHSERVNTGGHGGRGGDDDGGSNDGGGKGKRGGRLALIILAFVLGFAIVGAGAYALVHFVIFGEANNAPTEPIPTIAEEPSLYVPATPDEVATEAPTEPDYGAMAEKYMENMSDREKICQLFIVTPEVLTGVDGVTEAGDTTKTSIEKYPVGGIIYFDTNFESQDQTTKMIENTQKYAKTPMFISVDEEGGDVARVSDKLGTKKFDPMYEYKDQGAETAHDNAEVIASNLRGLGFNVDFAPVADILTNEENTVIGHRAYSDNAEDASTLVSAAVEGFEDGGVICVLKHFPGHGGTAEDSHESLAYVDTPVSDLKKNELQPFKAGIDAGADMVMVGHLVVTDLDPSLPATLSPKVVPELLRKELGYDGVVITDSMSMASITYSYDDTVKGIFDADIDIILQPDDLDAYLTSIEKLREDGTITQEQIDAKVKRILTLKFEKGIIPPIDLSATEAPTTAPSSAETVEATANTAETVDTALNDEE